MRAKSFDRSNTDNPSTRLRMTQTLQKGLTTLAKGGFKTLFNHIDQQTIKNGVDEMGLDRFINKCALLAAGSGAASGAGGLATMLMGAPLDMLNLVVQQFRVTM